MIEIRKGKSQGLRLDKGVEFNAGEMVRVR